MCAREWAQILFIHANFNEYLPILVRYCLHQHQQWRRNASSNRMPNAQRREKRPIRRELDIISWVKGKGGREQMRETRLYRPSNRIKSNDIKINMVCLCASASIAPEPTHRHRIKISMFLSLLAMQWNEEKIQFDTVNNIDANKFDFYFQSLFGSTPCIQYHSKWADVEWIIHILDCRKTKINGKNNKILQIPIGLSHASFLFC